MSISKFWTAGITTSGFSRRLGGIGTRVEAIHSLWVQVTSSLASPSKKSPGPHQWALYSKSDASNSYHFLQEIMLYQRPKTTSLWHNSLSQTYRTLSMPHALSCHPRKPRVGQSRTQKVRVRSATSLRSPWGKGCGRMDKTRGASYALKIQRA